MTFSLVGQLPRHLYVWVDSRFTHKEPVGFIKAVWFGLVSFPGRTWGCTVMLESGAIYRNLPPHAIAFDEHPEDEEWSAEEAQQWDCYGNSFSVIEYSYLAGLDLRARVSSPRIGGFIELSGNYLFTTAPIGDGFSAFPEQAKEFTFASLWNGRLTIQPTDRVVFKEKSFTNQEWQFPRGLKRQTDVWSCE